MSDGGTVEVPSRELVMPGKTFAVVGILDPRRSETLASLWTTVRTTEASLFTLRGYPQ